MFEPSETRRSPFLGIPAGAACLVMALWSLSACKVIDPPSGALACTSTAACDAPRVCEFGYCVVPPAFLPDADPAAPDADPAAPDGSVSIDSGIQLPDADPGACNAIALLDGFDDGAAAPLWGESAGSGVNISETGGVLTLDTPATPAAPTSAGYESLKRDYVLTNSSFFVEIPTMLSTDSKGAATLRIVDAANSQLEVQQRANQLIILLTLDNVTTELENIPFSATDHRWWRVVDFAGNFQVQTSANGTQWTNRATDASPAFFGSVGVDLLVRVSQTGSAPGPLVFDNANGGGAVPACP